MIHTNCNHHHEQITTPKHDSASNPEHKIAANAVGAVMSREKLDARPADWNPIVGAVIMVLNIALLVVALEMSVIISTAMLASWLTSISHRAEQYRERDGMHFRR